MTRLHKNHLRLSLLTALLAFVLTGCDPVAEDERYIEVKRMLTTRTVLLEEFTGQNCSNCPAAHRIIEALQEQYGQSLVSVSIHAGSFAYAEGVMEPTFQTFKTSDGDTYAQRWGIEVYPSGVVNRRGGVLLYSDWAAAIHSELERPTSLDISVQPALSVGSDEVVVDTRLSTAEPIEGSFHLWLVEDSIVSLQLDGSTRLPNYKHNNVYRASLTGTDGEPVSLSSAAPVELHHTLALQPRWNPSHLRVVAFVTDSQGVCQAAQAPLK